MKKKIISTISFIIVFLLSFRFFLYVDGNIGHNWDWSFPSLNIFFDKLSLSSLYTWSTYNLGEIVDLRLVHLVPNLLFGYIGQLVGAKLFLFLLFFLITAISYYGFKGLLDFLTEDSFLNYIPSFLFAFSPFLFNDIIGGSWVMWVSYAFCPIYFLFFLKYLKKNRIKYLLLSLTTSIFIIISIQNFILINLLISLYLIYEVIIIKNEEFKNIIKKLFIFLILMILINLYWILPFSYTFANFMKSTVLGSGGINALDPIKNSKQDIWNIFNLGGYWERNMYLHSMPMALSYLFQLTVGLAWSVVLIYFLKEKNKNNILKSIFWMASLLILIIIVKGGNSPFPEFTLWLYNSFPLMKLYRSPQHLMFIPAFIIPILIAFSLNYFYKNLRYKKTVLIVFTLIIAIWISGWWYNGDLGQKTLMEQGRDHVDFYQLPPELIKYYEESQREKGDYRTFFLPAAVSPIYLKTEYQNKAQGIQPEYIYLDKSTFTSESNKFANNIEMSFYKNTSFDYIRYLSLFSVKNIVLRSDIYPNFTESSNVWDNNLVKVVLDSSIALEKFLSGKYATAYHVKENYFLPHFYIPQNIIYSNVNIESLANIVNFKDYDIRSGIYLETDRLVDSTNLKKRAQATDSKLQVPNITFIKINPTKYRIKVEGAKEPYTLVFSESFHQGWKAYISKAQNDYGKTVASYFDGQIKEGTHRNIFLDRNTFETLGKKPIPEEKHSLVNYYANSWYITPEDSGGSENYEIIIEFWPQRLFYMGLFISGSTLIGCLSILIYSYLKKKWIFRKFIRICK